MLISGFSLMEFRCLTRGKAQGFFLLYNAYGFTQDLVLPPQVHQSFLRVFQGCLEWKGECGEDHRLDRDGQGGSSEKRAGRGPTSPTGSIGR